MNDETKIINERAQPGSGIKHDKHAPATEADIAAAEVAAEQAEAEAETPETIKEKQAEDCNNLLDAAPTKKSTKDEILLYCAMQGIEVDDTWTKTELLDAVTELLESENE